MEFFARVFSTTSANVTAVLALIVIAVGAQTGQLGPAFAAVLGIIAMPARVLAVFVQVVQATLPIIVGGGG